MSKQYDVVVVGAGLMGCSIAFQLSKRGIKTAVIEKNKAPGLETTARSGAIIRAHYGVPELVALAHAANERFLNFKEEVGYDSGFKQCGYIVLVGDGDVQTLSSNVAMHKDLGVDVSLLKADRIKELVPSLVCDDISLGAYEQKGGFANPKMTVEAYSKRASELGAVFLYDTTVIEYEPVTSAKTLTLSDGEAIECDQVVIATGNWSEPVGRLFGLDLPVSPVRAQITVVDRPDGTRTMPVVSDLINLAYFREEADFGMWVGSSDMADLQEKLDKPEGFNEVADPKPVQSALDKTKLRFLTEEGPYAGSVKRSFTGLYETTPDWQPIIDSFANGVHVAVGFSGHGFKLAPVIGDIMAGFVANEPSGYNSSIFRLGRFEDDRPIKSLHTYERARFLR